MQSNTLGTAVNALYKRNTMDDLATLANLDNLIDAFDAARRGCQWKFTVQNFDLHLIDNVRALKKEVLNGTYKQRPFFEFDIVERGKKRHIKALDVRDRVLQRCLCDYILVPKIYPLLIYDNGASVKGKGISFARERMVCHLQKYYRKYGNDGYILQIDFSKFFDSINQDIMLEMLKRLTDTKIHPILDEMIYSFSDDGISLGIGSQISQICGIYYLSDKIDRYCKIVKGIKFYGRYQDDIYAISNSKEELKELLADIIRLSGELGLKINAKKTKISRLSKGFTFLKNYYKICETGKIVQNLIRPTVTRERRKLKKYRKKLDAGEMRYKDIENAYKSWRNNNSKEDWKLTPVKSKRRTKKPTLDSYQTIMSMDSLFIQLFKEEMQNGYCY